MNFIVLMVFFNLHYNPPPHFINSMNLRFKAEQQGHVQSINVYEINMTERNARI